MKRRMNWLASGVLGGVLMMTAGCIMGFGGGVAPSTTPLEGREYMTLGPVSATDSSVMFLSFIAMSDFNSVDDAVKDALRKNNADALINVTVDTYSMSYLLFSRTYTRVNGTAIRFMSPRKQ